MAGFLLSDDAYDLRFFVLSTNIRFHCLFDLIHVIFGDSGFCIFEVTYHASFIGSNCLFAIALTSAHPQKVHYFSIYCSSNST